MKSRFSDGFKSEQKHYTMPTETGIQGYHKFIIHGDMLNNWSGTKYVTKRKEVSEAVNVSRIDKIFPMYQSLAYT